MIRPAPALALLLLSTAALAQSNHDRHHATYQNWINKDGTGCCNNDDCGELAPVNERVTPAGRTEVRILGQWCPVLPSHYLQRGNAPNWSTAHVCVSKQVVPDGEPSPCSRLLCYQPRPGT